MNSCVVLGALLCLAAAVTVSADPGFIQVRNEGDYVARAIAEWELNGKRESGDTGDFAIGVKEVIMIPDGAKNIYVKVYNYIFIDTTSTIISETFSGPVKKCYKVWGTRLVPKNALVDC